MTRDTTSYSGTRRGAQSERQRLAGGGGMGDVHVDSAPCQERRLGAGVPERCKDDDRYLWGAVRGGK